MIACDLVRCALVLVMAIPGVPLAGLVTLLFLVTLVGAPFTSARAAIYPDVLAGDRYVMGTAVTLTTYQFAQVIGFAAGGAIVGFFGTRLSLIIDAATFAVSALIVRAWVRSRPAPAPGVTMSRPGWPASSPAPGLSSPARPCAHRCSSAGWRRSTTPQRAWSPRSPGTCTAARLPSGVILAAQALGRDLGRDRVQPLPGPADTAAGHGPARCRGLRVLALFFLQPGLPGSLLILFASGLAAAYQIAANAAFVSAAPQEQRSQAFGLAQGGMSLGQGIVMILAGAAADHYSPAWVIAVCGAVGAVVALWRSRSAGPAIQSRRRTTPSALCRFRSTGRRAWRAPFVAGSGCGCARSTGRRACDAPFVRSGRGVRQIRWIAMRMLLSCEWSHGFSG